MHLPNKFFVIDSPWGLIAELCLWVTQRGQEKRGSRLQHLKIAALSPGGWRAKKCTAWGAKEREFRVLDIQKLHSLNVLSAAFPLTGSAESLRFFR
jgi:hypothetical protein